MKQSFLCKMFTPKFTVYLQIICISILKTNVKFLSRCDTMFTPNGPDRFKNSLVFGQNERVNLLGHFQKKLAAKSVWAVLVLVVSDRLFYFTQIYLKLASSAV